MNVNKDLKQDEGGESLDLSAPRSVQVNIQDDGKAKVTPRPRRVVRNIHTARQLQIPPRISPPSANKKTKKGSPLSVPKTPNKPTLQVGFPPTEIVVKSKCGQQQQQQQKETGGTSSSASASSNSKSSGNSNNNIPKQKQLITATRSGRSFASASQCSSVTNESGLLAQLDALEASRWHQHQQHQQDIHIDEWSCPACTYINKPMFLTCEMCGKARPPPSNNSSPNSLPFRSSLTDNPNPLPKRKPTQDSLLSDRNTSPSSYNISSSSQEKSSSKKSSSPSSTQQLPPSPEHATGDSPPHIPRRMSSIASLSTASHTLSKASYYVNERTLQAPSTTHLGSPPPSTTHLIPGSAHSKEQSRQETAADKNLEFAFWNSTTTFTTESTTRHPKSACNSSATTRGTCLPPKALGNANNDPNRQSKQSTLPASSLADSTDDQPSAATLAAQYRRMHQTACSNAARRSRILDVDSLVWESDSLQSVKSLTTVGSVSC